MTKNFKGNSAQDIIEQICDFWQGFDNQSTLLETIKEIWYDGVFCPCQDCDYIEHNNANEAVAYLVNNEHATIVNVTLSEYDKFTVDILFEDSENAIEINLENF